MFVKIYAISCLYIYVYESIPFLKILCVTSIFIFKLLFPPDESVAYVLKELLCL